MFEAFDAVTTITAACLQRQADITAMICCKCGRSNPFDGSIYRPWPNLATLQEAGQVLSGLNAVYKSSLSILLAENAKIDMQTAAMD